MPADPTSIQLILEFFLLLLLATALVCHYNHLIRHFLFITWEPRQGKWPQIYIVVDQEELWWLSLALAIDLVALRDCVEIWLGNCRGVEVEWPHDPEGWRQVSNMLRRMGSLV